VASLVAAARYFMKRNRPGGVNRSTRDIIADYLAEAEADGLRPASMTDLRNRLGRFCNAFGDAPLCTIDKAAIMEWSRGDHTAKRDGTPCAPLSRKHYLVVVGGLFNYALDNKLVVENPMESTSRRRRKATGMADQHMPEIITPAEVQAVLRAAQATEPEMLAPLAIGFFAGVRTTELARLDWANISLTDKRITITPEIAKKRSVRHIDIADNLLAWLAPLAKDSGAITPTPGAWRFKFDRIRTEAGTRWPHNAMRHCFASYYLMKTDDANKTALQLGHRDTNLLFNHYRGLATREDAAKFWAIVPVREENVIEMRQQKAG
jgi:integrase